MQIFGLIFLIFMGACRSQSQPKTQAVQEQERCGFFTIRLERDTVTNKTTASLSDLKVVDTKVRYVLDEAKSHEPNFLKIEVIYSDHKINAFTEHPLYKRLDLYSESGKIESKSISLSQGEVFLRIPYFGAYKRINIVPTVNFKELPAIIIRNEK